MGGAFTALRALHERHARGGPTLPSPPAGEPVWSGAAIGIAGVPLVIAHRDVETITALPPLTRIPGTGNRVLGVAAYQGDLLPVFCGDTLFGQRLSPGRRREYCLVICQPGLHVGLTLSQVGGNVTLPLSQRSADMPLQGLLAACCDGGFRRGEEFLGLLDSGLLMASGVLGDTSAQPADPIEDAVP
ncbi:chemotaxis protein CheW [Haliea sp.]|uniref:chemotaxis protein CheW n=1 Tax=Haliea sp. TaxID=1932666 RepID=UPI0035295210